MGGKKRSKEGMKRRKEGRTEGKKGRKKKRFTTTKIKIKKKLS